MSRSDDRSGTVLFVIALLVIIAMCIFAPESSHG